MLPNTFQPNTNEAAKIHTKNVKLDLHGMNRWKARKALFRRILQLLVSGKKDLLVIHGYHHGTVLRDYIRDGRFLRDLHTEYPLLPPVKIVPYQPGATKILIQGRAQHVA